MLQWRIKMIGKGFILIGGCILALPSVGVTKILMKMGIYTTAVMDATDPLYNWIERYTKDLSDEIYVVTGWRIG